MSEGPFFLRVRLLFFIPPFEDMAFFSSLPSFLPPQTAFSGPGRRLDIVVSRSYPDVYLPTPSVSPPVDWIRPFVRCAVVPSFLFLTERTSPPPYVAPEELSVSASKVFLLAWHFMSYLLSNLVPSLPFSEYAIFHPPPPLFVFSYLCFFFFKRTRAFS